MTIYILLAIGLFFLLFTGVLIAIDNRKRRFRKKMLPLCWRAIGIITTLLAVLCFVIFFQKFYSFQGTECSSRKIILRSTMNVSDVSIPTKDAKLNKNLENAFEEIVTAYNSGDKNHKIKYVDALLNNKTISLEDIHEIKYSNDLSKKQVQIVEYLVDTKDGFFTKPGIYYYIIFSEAMKNDEKAVTKDKTKETQQKTQKKSDS